MTEIPITTMGDGGACPVPAGCIHEWIEAQARRSPHAAAVVFGNRSLTYAQLSGLAASLASRLIDGNVTPGDPVVVALPRSLMTVAAILGIFKARGVYVPVDPETPGPRLLAMLADAEPRCVVTLDRIGRQLQYDGTFVAVDDLEIRSGEDCVDAVPIPEIRCGKGKGDDAYIMYTSGSTGVPKGVVIEHGALALFASSIAREIPFDASACHLAITRTTFDISLLELLVPLCHGGRVVVASSEDVNNPARLVALIEKHPITSLQATPGYLRTAIQQCPNLTRGIRVLVGGEALPSDLARALVAVSPEVWNLYGPTEATIWASAHKVTREDFADGAAPIVTIGKALSNYRMYVLDEALRAVPLGAEGHLYIAGQALAKEYFRKPVLTLEAFSADVVGSGAERMYRTGDMARFRPDGNLEFLGRLDRQVKIRGVRLELGDVESALRKVPGITDAVVVVRPSSAGEKELIGYVVTDSAERAGGNAVRRELGRLVPDYMVPAAICPLKAIPLTSHGKIDRNALPDPGAIHTAERSGDGHGSGTLQEARICSIFAEVLGIERVVPDDNFFDLGGHSLTGMRLLNRVRAEFHVELSLRDLFDAATFADVVEEISRLQTQ